MAAARPRSGCAVVGNTGLTGFTNVLLNQPVIVPIRNTDANRVLTILNSLYRTQLSSGGGRKQVSIPEGSLRKWPRYCNKSTPRPQARVDVGSR